MSACKCGNINGGCGCEYKPLDEAFMEVFEEMLAMLTDPCVKGSCLSLRSDCSCSAHRIDRLIEKSSKLLGEKS